MKISNLRVNGHLQPIGYHFDHLTFSWDLIGNSTEEILFQRVLIAVDSEFNTVVESADTTSSQNILSVNHDFLSPRTRYYWKVITQLKTGIFEKVSYFESGKLTEPWDANWISYSNEAIDSVIFSKEFSLAKKIKSGRLYCCGYGLYEATINGMKITKEVLLPGYHSYDLLNQYQTFDITEQLRQNNQLSILTGNGWYKGRFVFDGGYENIYGEKQKLIAEIIVEYEDGTSIKCVSDDSWSVTTSFIKENSIYDGETIDYHSKPNQLEITELSNGKELLDERSNPPILKQKVFRPQKAFFDKTGSIVLDFGQIITGWLEGNVASDQPIRFRFAELLQEGVFYQDNLRTAKQEFSIFSPKEEIYVRPHFTFFGFRYVQVTGLSMEQAVELKAYAIHSDMEELFKFDSSNDKLNQLVKNIQWSQRDNFLDIPTDCPQRDERMGWTGDVTVFANASCYNMNTRSFYENYLRNLSLEQNNLSGSVPFFVPFPKIDPHEGINPFLVSDGAAVWSDVATVLPFQLYRHYKDKALLAKNLEVMENWVNYVYERDVANGSKHLWNFDRQLGDWLALDTDDSRNPIGATDPNLIASIYYYKSTSNLAKCLQFLEDERAEKYMQLATEIHQAIVDEYFINNKLLLKKVTQTALALLLRNSLYPSEQAKKELQIKLIELLKSNNNFLNTGFVGTPELTHALAENNFSEAAYTLLLNEECPGWLYEVNQGATTVWERWDSISPDGTINGTDMNSLNHYAYGAVQDFIIEKVLGLSHVDESSEILTMKLEPYFDRRLDWVKGSFKTSNGQIEISWKWRNQKIIDLEVEIPHDTQLVYIKGNHEKSILNSGTTTLEVVENDDFRSDF